jgi:hypothetical protein
MQTTYDPILGGPEELSYWQVRALPPPRLGTALVLISARGELITCPAGSPVPAVRFGKYRSVYYIDTAEHQLILDAQLQSSAPGFFFQAHLTYRCTVKDPAAIALRQIHDMGELLAPSLIPLMRNATRRLDIEQSTIAEEAIQTALTRASCDPAVQISAPSVEFPVHADEAVASGRTFRDAHRGNRITKIKVEPLRELLAGGSPDLLALHLANHPDDTGPVMEMIVAGDIVEAQNMLHAIGMIYGRGGADEEPFETREERKKLMDRFLARALPAGGRYLGGSGTAAGERRREGSRLRGSLSPGIDNGPAQAIVGAVVADDVETPAGRTPPSRLVLPHTSRRDPDIDDER